MSLRFATGKPASRDSVCGTAQLAAWLCRYAQTNGGKSDHDATLSCGTVARSLNRVPQLRAQGVDTEFAGLVTNKPLAIIYQTVAAIYFDNEAIPLPLPFCPRLRRLPLVAGGCTAECRRSAIKFAEICLNGVPQAHSDFVAQQREVGGVGLPRSAAKGTRQWGQALCLLSGRRK